LFTSNANRYTPVMPIIFRKVRLNDEGEQGEKKLKKLKKCDKQANFFLSMQKLQGILDNFFLGLFFRHTGLLT